MQGHRLSSTVSSVTLLQQNENGEVTPVPVYVRGKKKRRKTTTFLRPVEKVLEELMDAERETTRSYRAKFRSSSRKKRDGWLIDLVPNVFKAVRAGARSVRIERIL